MEHDRPGTEQDRDLCGLRRTSETLMTQPTVRIDARQARTLLEQFQSTARIRGWNLLAAAVMNNHVHLVVGVDEDVAPEKLLGDFKAYGSRALSGESNVKQKWWTSKGSTRKLSDRQAVERAIRYVLEQAGAFAIWPDQANVGESAPRDRV